MTQVQFKYFLKLLQKKFRRSERLFLVEGIHTVEEALASGWRTEALLVAEEFRGSSLPVEKLVQNALRNSVQAFEISTRQLEKLSETVTSQGIIGVVHQSQQKTGDTWKGKNLVALDGVADPGNAGTIIRTCDWFGVDTVLLDKNCVELYNPKVVRATMGSIFHLPILHELALPNALMESKAEGFRILVTALSPEKKPAPKSFPGRWIIVFGSEAHGVSPEIRRLADEVVTIPRYGDAESLNVAVACGIVLATVKAGIPKNLEKS